jgi:glycosyltransferase involved in cell wall biosynthesis
VLILKNRVKIYAKNQFKKKLSVEMYVPTLWGAPHGLAQASLGLANEVALKCDLTVHTFYAQSGHLPVWGYRKDIPPFGKVAPFRVLYHPYFVFCNSRLFSPSVLRTTLTSDAEIFHIQGLAKPINGFILQTLAKFKNKKVVLTGHTLLEGLKTIDKLPLSGFFKACLINFYVKRFDHIIVLTKEGKRRLEQSGLKPEKISVIPNAICESKFQSCSDLLPHSEKRLRLLCVGGFNRNKGHEILLKVLSRLKEKEKVVCFFVGSIGDEKNYRRIVKMVNELDLEDIVKIKLSVSDSELTEYYKYCDIFVMPSLEESFTIAALEAMSFGLPVVASAVGALPELIKNGWNGFLVEPGNVDQFIEMLQRLLEDAKMRSIFGQNGRKVASLYSWQQIAEKTCAVYLNL